MSDEMSVGKPAQCVRKNTNADNNAYVEGADQDGPALRGIKDQGPKRVPVVRLSRPWISSRSASSRNSVSWVGPPSWDGFTFHLSCRPA